MRFEPLSVIESPALVMPQADIDTDAIIPARFLKVTERAGLGVHAFEDLRARGDGAGGPHALDDPRAADCRILVAGANFGCGSSREHAPWALVDAGFRVVVSSRIADIFRANAWKNGLLAIEVDAAIHRALLAAPWGRVRVDLEACRIDGGGASASFPVDPFARRCLLDGRDPLDYLLDVTGAAGAAS